MLELERTLSYRLHLLHKLTDMISQRAYVADTGLSMSVGRCLTAVGSFAPLSVNDLAQKANLNKGQASRAAQALVGQGLVEKAASQTDGRGVVLSLTAAGHTAWLNAMGVVERRNHEIFGLLNDQEQQQLSAMFDCLLTQARTQVQTLYADGQTPLARKAVMNEIFPRSERMNSDVCASLRYQSGFGNEFASEAVPGALPQGRNSPQRAPHALYTELLSGTAFTAPRAENRRTWLYRRQPSAVTGHYQPYNQPLWTTGAAGGVTVPPNPLRWRAFAIPAAPQDFVDGMSTLAANGYADAQSGIAVHMYLANCSMVQRALVNTDGEMLLVPQQGRLQLTTELGILQLAPGEIGVVPRGMAFSVALLDGPSRGYVCENYGEHFRLPELGPIGSNGLANARDFLAPTAAFDETPAAAGGYQIIKKYGGSLWACRQAHSPFNVVAWHGNLVPYKYDTAHFMTIGSISYDHPDPSIFTVLTSPSGTPGTANCDFVIFPPRWMVAENTFRPPWYHRNLMSEFMGLVYGEYDAKPEGFKPGGASLHNCMVPHGPDFESFEKASSTPLTPHKLDNTLAIMFESRYRFVPTAFAMQGDALDPAYAQCWQGLQDNFQKEKS